MDLNRFFIGKRKATNHKYHNYKKMQVLQIFKAYLPRRRDSFGKVVARNVLSSNDRIRT